MERAELLPNEQQVLELALKALERQTGLQTHIAATQQLDLTGRPDATIKIGADGHEHEFVVEIKTRLDRAVMLANVKNQLARQGQLGDRALLVTDYLTTNLAERCRRELQLQFIDAAGNAYINRPGRFVLIQGMRPTALQLETTPRERGTATALRVIFALLCEPRLLNAPYREIVAAADVALGAVGWVFFDLATRGIVLGKKAGMRQLVERERLVDEWIANYHLKLRQKLNPRRFRADQPAWWEGVKLNPTQAQWGGQIAADMLTGYLRPTTCIIYVDPKQRAEAIANLAAKHRLRADPEGDIEILDRFWNLPAAQHNPECVPPLLVIADLMATLEPRNIETAQMVRKNWLANVAG